MSLMAAKKRSKAMSAPRRAQKAMSREARAMYAEGAGTRERVSTAAGDSWADIKRTVDPVLVDVRATGTATVKRFRSALGG